MSAIINRASVCISLIIALSLTGCATRDFCRVVPFPLRDGAGVAVQVLPFWQQVKADPIGATAAVGTDLLTVGGVGGLAWLLYSISEQIGDSDSHDTIYNVQGDMQIGDTRTDGGTP